MTRTHRHLVATLAAAGAGLALAVGAAGCGGDDDGAGERKPANQVTVAMLTASTAQSAFQEMALGAKAAAGAEGVRLHSAAPAEISPPEQMRLFQAAMQTSRDGIATETTVPRLFARPFAEAAALGVPLVSVDAPPPPGSGVETFVGNDNAEVGGALATAILARIPGAARGEIVLGTPMRGNPVLDARIAGMQRVLRAERPDISVKGPFTIGLHPAQNDRAWTGIVKAHPHALAYLDSATEAVVALARIQQRTGRRLLVGGTGIHPVALQAVKDGRVHALVDPEHWLKGYIAISLLARLARDGTELPKGWWNPGSALVTARNVDRIVARQRDNATRAAYFKAEVDKQLADPERYVEPLPTAR